MGKVINKCVCCGASITTNSNFCSYSCKIKSEKITLLHKLIDKDFNVNWEEVEKIPEFIKLKDGGYHSDWHTEGNSFTHTNLVVNEVYKLPEWNDLGGFYKLCLVGAALFHDIGKGVSHKLGEDGNWSAPHHSKIGEKLTRYMLWNEPFDVRETICSLIRYHMKPKHFRDKTKIEVEKSIIEISHNSHCKLQYLLDKCDRAGALGPFRELEISLCESLKEQAIELNCFEQPYQFFSKQSKLRYFQDQTYLIEKTDQYSPEHNFTIYIMCGIAGSGKSSYTKEFLKNLPIISRDKVRVELGYVEKDGKFKGNKSQESNVTEVINKQIKDLCEKKESFVYDNLNIRKMYRDEFINFVKRYNPEIVIVYVETSRDNNILRRKLDIPESQITKMQKEMDIPYSTESHRLVVNRN